MTIEDAKAEVIRRWGPEAIAVLNFKMSRNYEVSTLTFCGAYLSLIGFCLIAVHLSSGGDGNFRDHFWTVACFLLLMAFILLIHSAVLLTT